MLHVVCCMAPLWRTSSTVAMSANVFEASASAAKRVVSNGSRIFSDTKNAKYSGLASTCPHGVQHGRHGMRYVTICHAASTAQDVYSQRTAYEHAAHGARGLASSLAQGGFDG